MADYDVISPIGRYNGLSYEHYCEDWANWLVLINPEGNNNGPVYFLHCVACPEQQSGYGYNPQPVVRIGSQALNIRPGEAVFLPIIECLGEAIDNGVQDNEADLRAFVRFDMDRGDNPPSPNQATIDGNDIVDDLGPYLIETKMFTLNVPPSPPNTTSLRNCLDIPITTPGSRNCVIRGYWILIQFNTPKTYYLRTFAKGRGQYQISMFYQITVSGPHILPKVGAPAGTPAWAKAAILKTAQNKQTDKEITDPEFTAINNALP